MFYDDQGRTITIKRELAQGGEGRLCTVNEDQTVLLKLLHTPTPEHAAKITVMLNKRPRDHGIAWPTTKVRDEYGRYAGLLMPWVKDGLHISQVYNPVSRTRIAPRFTYHYLTVAAANIARITQSLHERGYVIGDIGDANILAHANAEVTQIDADSIQVPRPDGRGHYRCSVGTEEYTPPELFGVTLATIDRTVRHDHHGLAVLLFRTLMEGVHPYASKYHGPGDPPRLTEKISKGLWPYDSNQRFSPPPAAPSFTMLPTAVQGLFRRAFVDGHHHPASRPSAAEWHHALTRFHQALRPCNADKGHYYSKHLSRCPWCERRVRVQPATLAGQYVSHAPTIPGGRILQQPQPGLWHYTTQPTVQPSITTTVDHEQLRAAIDDGIRDCVDNFYAVAAHPNATPTLRAVALHNATVLPHILRDNEITVIQQVIAICQRDLNNPELPDAERETKIRHIRKCEQRLRTIL